LRSFFKGRPNTYLISANILSKELTNDQWSLIRLAYSDLHAHRVRNQDIHPDIPDLANTITANLFEKLARAGHRQSRRFESFVHGVVLNNLATGWQDTGFTPGFTPTESMTLFTGTGGAYLARVVSHAFQIHGAKVIRSTHGGDSALFDDPLWASIELPFADIYMTYGMRAADRTNAITERHMSVRDADRQITAVAGGSQYHREILERATPNAPVKTVYMVSASFSGTLRAIPNVKIHDVVYYEWHRRLLQLVRSAGFKAVSKRHPTGRGADLTLFADVASEELRQARMSDTFDLPDAYIMDIAGGAFIEAVCTLKPIVLVDIPSRRMTDEGRACIGESVQIVRAHFDENNRVVASADQIIEGLHKPVDVEARQRFISEYLTTPDSNLEQLMAGTSF